MPIRESDQPLASSKGGNFRLKSIVALAGLAPDAGEAGPSSLVPGTQIDRTRVRSCCLGLVAEPLIGEPSCAPYLCVKRVSLYGLVEIGRCFLRLVERKVAQCARQQ